MIPIHKYKKIQQIKSPNYGILILTIKGNNIYSGILTVANDNITMIVFILSIEAMFPSNSLHRFE